MSLKQASQIINKITGRSEIVAASLLVNPEKRCRSFPTIALVRSQSDAGG